MPSEGGPFRPHIYAVKKCAMCYAVWYINIITEDGMSATFYSSKYEIYEMEGKL
jgi:hypothetical protein